MSNIINIETELGLNNWGDIQLNPCFDPDQPLQYTKPRNSKRNIDEVFYSDDERDSCTVTEESVEFYTHPKQPRKIFTPMNLPNRERPG
jgi:hypothetical protein